MLALVDEDDNQLSVESENRNRAGNSDDDTISIFAKIRGNNDV